MTSTLNGCIDCPMCEWGAAIVYSLGPQTDERFLTGLYQNHVDAHCEAFAREMDMTLPGVPS